MYREMEWLWSRVHGLFGAHVRHSKASLEENVVAALLSPEIHSKGFIRFWGEVESEVGWESL